MQSSMVFMDHSNGEILALVGGRNRAVSYTHLVIMLLGLLLLLWFIVVYVQVIAMSQGFQGFCRSLLAAVGNLLLALMVVYAGSALYTQRKPKIGSWQIDVYKRQPL